MRGQASSHHVVARNPNVTPVDLTTTIATGAAALLFPAVVVVSIIARRRYRQRVRQHRIAQLERSWQLNPHQNSY